MLVAGLWHCTWGRGREGAMAPAPLSTGPQSLPLLPTIKLGPSGAGSRVGGLAHALGPCGSLQRPLLWGWEFLLLPPQPPRVFSIWGLRPYFPKLDPWVTRSASLPALCPGLSVRECGASGCYHPLCLPCSPPLWVQPSRFIWANVGPQGLLVVRLPAPFVPHSTSLGPTTATRVLSAPAARLRPSYRSGWMFIFYLLGVGLPCPLIFCQLWMCEEAQCVYLRLHLGSRNIFLKKNKNQLGVGFLFNITIFDSK